MSHPNISRCNFRLQLAQLAAAKSNKHITVQKASIHQLTTMLATSKNVLYPGGYDLEIGHF